MTLKVDGTNGVLQAYDYQVLTTGFSYTFAAGTQLLLAVPAGTLATGTVTMPASPADGMNITITSTQQITALTVNANTGQSIVGGGALNLQAGGSRTFVYRLASTTWYAQMGTPVVDIQQFDAGGGTTWTKPNGGQTMVKIQVWAGGGGGARSASANQGGPGGGGAYNEFICPISYMGSTATVTVGAAGVGRTGSAGVGTAGGNSSVAVANYPSGSKTIIAYGGAGGTNASSGGGGGGGVLSAGSTSGYGGLGYVASRNYTATPVMAAQGGTLGGLSTTYATASGDPTAGGNAYGSFSTCSTSFATGSIYGGGGGSGTTASGTNTYGGNSMYGGGGGSTVSGNAGTSLYGGNGGGNAAGTTPGGGGGGTPTANTNAFDGGAGRIVITSW